MIYTDPKHSHESMIYTDPKHSHDLHRPQTQPWSTPTPNSHDLHRPQTQPWSTPTPNKAMIYTDPKQPLYINYTPQPEYRNTNRQKSTATLFTIALTPCWCNADNIRKNATTLPFLPNPPLPLPPWPPPPSQSPSPAAQLPAHISLPYQFLVSSNLHR